MTLCPWPIAELAPSLCFAVDAYCERTGPALDAEPLNAASNLAFIVAGLMAWRLQRHHAVSGAGAIQLLIGIVLLIGVGSFLFHTVATRWAAWADVLPIMLFILVYLGLVLRRYFRWPWWAALPALAAFFLVTLYGEAIVPPTLLRGGSMYVPALLAMVATGLALLPGQPAAGRAMLAASAVFAVSFTARSLDLPLCQAFPLGTHFLWHLLNGLLLFLLLRLAIIHPPARPATG